jgi:hypothetical protein
MPSVEVNYLHTWLQLLNVILDQNEYKIDSKIK